MLITLAVDNGRQVKVDQLGLECVVGVTLTDKPESSVQKHGLFAGAGLLLYGHCRTVSGRQAWVEAGVSQLGSAI